MIFKNINLNHYTSMSKVIFLEYDLKLQPKSLKEIFEIAFKKSFHVKFWNNFSSNEMLKTTTNLSILVGKRGHSSYRSKEVNNCSIF